MKVKFLRNTYDSKHGFLVAGQEKEIKIDESTLTRWVRVGLVEGLEDRKVYEKPTIEELPDSVELSDLTNAELYELCMEKGLEPKQKQSKAYYLDLLA
jgi:hypothetical protein